MKKKNGTNGRFCGQMWWSLQQTKPTKISYEIVDDIFKLNVFVLNTRFPLNTNKIKKKNFPSRTHC